MPFETYAFAGVPEIVVPASIDAQRFGTDSVGHFRRFVNTHHKALAYTKADRNTTHRKFNLNPRKKAALWFVHTNDNRPEQKNQAPVYLMIGSNSNGQYGGQIGLLHRIFEKTTEIDEDPSSPTHGKKAFGNVTDPETGRNLIIKVSGAGQDRKYIVNASSSITPLEHILTPILQDYPALFEELKPLEEVLHIPSDEELVKTLEAYARSLGQEAILTEFLGPKSPVAPSTMERVKQTQTPTPAPIAKNQTATAASEADEDDIPMSYETDKPAAVVTPPAKPAEAPKAVTPVAAPITTPAPKVQPSAPKTEDEPQTAAAVSTDVGMVADMKLLKIYCRTSQAFVAANPSKKVPEMNAPTSAAFQRLAAKYTTPEMSDDDKKIFEDAAGF
jgi:hypothetical protein